MIDLVAYLSARGYAIKPPVDARPPSLVSSYTNVVFGMLGDIALAICVTAYPIQRWGLPPGSSLMAIYALRPQMNVGRWFSAPRGALSHSRAYVSEPLMSTGDAAYDAQVETFGRGPDGPRDEIRARVLAFPGGVRSAGWYEGRVMVTLLTYDAVDAVRMDAAFALVHACF